MTYETILFTQANGIARLALNRPDRLNSFTVRMHEEVQHALTQLENARVLILTGAGRGFCAGQDLGDRMTGEGGARPDLGETVERQWNPLIRRLTSLPIPVICAMNGVAAGAGASVAFACDLVLAARSARFIQSFVNVGLIPDSGGAWILPRLVGQARALGMALTGEPLPAETAADWGLIWRAVDDADLEAETDKLATRLAALPPLALRETKRLLRAAWGQTLDAALDEQRDVMRALGRTEDYAEGVAAFSAKRTPIFSGR